MAYTINKTDGSVVATITDGTVDNTTSVQLFGKSFSGFGEAYFSKIDYNKIKGWTIHKEMTLNLIVPLGQVMFVIFDDRIKSNSRGNFNKIVLSNSNYQRLTVPPKLWVAFKGISKSFNLILNIANLKHNPLEMEKLPLNKIKYNWNSS